MRRIRTEWLLAGICALALGAAPALAEGTGGSGGASGSSSGTTSGSTGGSTDQGATGTTGTTGTTGATTGGTAGSSGTTGSQTSDKPAAGTKNEEAQTKCPPGSAPDCKPAN